MSSLNWVDDVLTFWFEKLTPKQWYISTPEIDAQISDKFKTLVLSIADNLPDAVKTSPDACLAAIICFDQFTRNIFRGEGTAFSFDPMALELAKHIRAKGWDVDMDAMHKQFSYMPFMHAEDLQMQKISLELFKGQGDEGLKAAQDHHDIIAQFGRYPHRNACLDRKTTAEELEYLKDAQRFGQ